MNKIVIFLIKSYKNIGKNIGKRPSCVFYPTCSDYALGVFQKFSFIKACYLTIKRIFRCHPFQKNHIDSIP